MAELEDRYRKHELEASPEGTASHELEREPATAVTISEIATPFEGIKGGRLSELPGETSSELPGDGNLCHSPGEKVIELPESQAPKKLVATDD